MIEDSEVLAFLDANPLSPGHTLVVPKAHHQFVREVPADLSASAFETVAPDCVVPTGRHATESLLAMTDRALNGFLEAVLDPIETEALPPLLPVLHPSYQDVWIRRLGYEPAEYERAVGDALERLGAASRR